MANNNPKNRNVSGPEGVEPAVTPPPVGAETTFIRKPKISSSPAKKKEIPEGIWTKCPKCANLIFDKELDANQKVCPTCEYHFPIGAHERISSLVEPGSFEEHDAGLTSVDILEFTGVATYTSKLEAYQKSTGLKDAVITGLGTIGAHRVAIGAMDFSFLGGSMGSVVGEKLTRLIEEGTKRKLPVIIISTSGGARMYEGMFSLMQMAKTCGALGYHSAARLPYISILTHPTTAGVMASYASVGDLILAEPGAMIGFAGPRVIKDTTQAELPPGFQTAEFLLDHGMLDAIINRKELKERLTGYLDFLMNEQKPAAKAG
jgi:acetyl-CoA carboxylase carboxyl transferase subunit beta